MLIEIQLFVDENGNYKLIADGDELCDNLDTDVAIRKVTLRVNIPEPTEEDHAIDAGEVGSRPVTITT